MENQTVDDHRWLQWAKAITAIAHTGLAYTDNAFDKERYEQLSDIAQEMLSSHSTLSATTLKDALATEVGYFTPKVDVRGFVIKDNKILMVQERSDQKWTLPGGWADVNISPSENAVKEIHEEAGFETQVIRLLALWDKHKHDHPPHFPHTYKFFFHCDITGGTATPSIETTDVGFFSLDALPDLSVHRVTASQIHKLWDIVHDKKPTAFD